MNDLAMRMAYPPDPNTRPPHWTLPKNACDSHIHVFGPPHLFPYADSRRYTPPAAPIEHYWNVQEITGLSRACVVQPSAHGVDNRAILDAIAKSNGRIVGIANIDDTTTDAEMEMMSANGIKGARFSLMDERDNSPTTDAVAAQLPRMVKHDWIFDFHCDPDDLVTYEKFVRDLPMITVIDHMARVRPKGGLEQRPFQLLLELLKDDKYWVKICSFDKLSGIPKARVETGLPFLDMVPFAQAVIAVAPDRVLWGSDWPHGNTFKPGRTPNEGDLLDIFKVIAPDEETRKKILVDNPARLFGFPED
jgi:2-pyrone-4,6-dicarboxylate lactonase